MNPTEQRSKHKIDRTVPGLTRKERSLRDITKANAGGKTQRFFICCMCSVRSDTAQIKYHFNFTVLDINFLRSLTKSNFLSVQATNKKTRRFEPGREFISK